MCKLNNKISKEMLNLIKIGDFNKLKVKRKANFGYFLDGKTNQTKDDILLHNRL